MNKLKCPYCQQPVCVEIEKIIMQEYVIQERLDVVSANGIIGPPTFVLAKPKKLPATPRHLIRCTVCERRFYEIAVGLKVDEENQQLILENFTERTFRSYDNPWTAPKEKPSKFVLKQRPK